MPSHRSRGQAPRLRPGRLSTRHLLSQTGGATTPSTATGRWFATPTALLETTVATQALCDQLLARYGVVTRGSVTAEDVVGGFARIYKALNIFEDSGQVRRGYYVDGLGGAQFAGTSTVDQLRRHALTDDAPGSHRAPNTATVLAATDPANPYGAALPWPDTTPGAGGHRPGRKPGALVCLVEGELVAFVERGGKTVLTFSDDVPALEAMAAALADIVRAGRVARLTIDSIDGVTALRSDLQRVLVGAGFATTPRGLRMRYGQHA